QSRLRELVWLQCWYRRCWWYVYPGAGARPAIPVRSRTGLADRISRLDALARLTSSCTARQCGREQRSDNSSGTIGSPQAVPRTQARGSISDDANTPPHQRKARLAAGLVFAEALGSLIVAALRPGITFWQSPVKRGRAGAAKRIPPCRCREGGLALALRAVGYADVRSGILPPQSGYRFAIPG